jgi:hypothetical protein
MIKILTICAVVSLSFFQCSQRQGNSQNDNSGNLNQNINSAISESKKDFTKTDLLGIWKGTEANDTDLWYLNFKENNEFEELKCGRPKQAIQTFRYELYREDGKVTIKLSNVDLPLHPVKIGSNRLEFELPQIPMMDKKLTSNIDLYNFERAEKMDCKETNRNY